MSSSGAAAKSLSAIAIVVAGVLPGGCLVPRERSAPRDLRRTSGPLDSEGLASTSSLKRALGAIDAVEQPLSLTDLQGLARRRNPNVEEWRARTAAASARTRQVRSLYFPHLRSDGSYVRLDEGISFSDPVGGEIVVADQETYEQTTVLAYDAFDWGRRHFLHQSSLQEEGSAEARLVRAMQELDFRVASVYFGIFETRRDLDVSRASVTSLEGALARARDLRAVDLVTDADVLVVEARLERRRFETLQLRRLASRRVEDLVHLLDLSPGSDLGLSTSEGLSTPEGLEALVARHGTAPLEPDEGDLPWEDLAFVQRAELTALNFAHEAVDSARRAERAAGLPTVGVYFRHQHSTTGSAFARTDVLSGGLNAQWEIFSGLRRQARVDELEARAREMRAQHRALVHRVQSELRDALRGLRLAIKGVDVAARVVVHARGNLDRVTANFEQGRATGQELLEAEGLLRTEDARENRARYEVLRSAAYLRFVCGLDHDEDLEP